MKFCSLHRRPLPNAVEEMEGWARADANQASKESPMPSGGCVKRYGVTRRVAVTGYGFSALRAMVVGTGLIATVHTRLARALQPAWSIELRPPPLPITAMEQGCNGISNARKIRRRAVTRMDTRPGTKTAVWLHL